MRGPTAIILEPARDLAEQTHENVVRFSKHLVRFEGFSLHVTCIMQIPAYGHICSNVRPRGSLVCHGVL